MEAFIVIIFAVLGLAALGAFLLGAVGFFSMASEQGFIGIAAYIACWVFLAPVMAVVCILFGIYIFFSDS